VESYYVLHSIQSIHAWNRFLLKHFLIDPLVISHVENSFLNIYAKF